MNYQQKYSNIKRVYHDRQTGLTTYERIDKHQICFDSTSEFKAYILMEEHFSASHFQIEIHPTLAIGKSEWEIDFSITARQGNTSACVLLAEIVNSINGTSHNSINKIFVEYKGFQDKNFVKKMSNVVISAPNFSKSIILVSDYDSAFGCYDKNRKRFYCHPILSMPLFKSILESIL
ncbi:hypothetical protein [Nostoc sp. PA-18-2419]|uniref:hypothetical protein n=1 Tax=Nostoc sp. PA-18-2419 TaxID=2575443 RepID=UPI0011085D95|nr:hypothetical protein [Nostoc sp. PA-18-2419]